MNKINYIQLLRTEQTETLLKDYPNAFLLLSIIALRARRTDCHISGLKINQAKIGDYKSCGLTENKYRTAKKQLQKMKIVTFKSTNRGTIATLCNTDIYNINITLDNEQFNEQTTNRPRTDNEQITTNKNDNNDKNENIVVGEIKISQPQSIFEIKKEKELKFKEKVWDILKNDSELNKFFSQNKFDEAKSFVNYWTESSEKSKTLKFEKQKSFDIKRRLQTWQRNNFQKQTSQKHQQPEFDYKAHIQKVKEKQRADNLKHQQWIENNEKITVAINGKSLTEMLEERRSKL